METEYTVAVFPYQGQRRARFNAYLRDYSPEWHGCNIVKVTAKNGKEAKAKAIEAIRLKLVENPRSVRFWEHDEFSV